ncbi:hypothetical protein MMC15_007854 [Xylographa vitiligo]|nr:hypothetical protein [Xylographa vitiligo]
MRVPSASTPVALLFTVTSSLLSLVAAGREISSNSLLDCSSNPNPGFTATVFDVVFTPDDDTLTYDINADSTITGNVTFQIQAEAYGITVFNKTINPCEDADLVALCPLNPGQIPINSSSVFSESVVNQIPWIAYTWPDLDGTIKVYLLNTTTGAEIGCVQANLSNGKTVDQAAVSWVIAVIVGLALVVSAVTSGLGHSNTAAHIAANTLSLFGFFQAQAMIGMTGVHMPPMVEAWTQNFQWSMGIVSIGFMQSVCTWYQMATGGTPSTVLTNVNSQSVNVEKRSLAFARKLASRGLDALDYIMRRDTTDTTDSTSSIIDIYGIDRVGFRSNVEPTNIFLTGLGFFVAFVVIVAVGVALFKGICEVAVKAGWLKSDKFEDFRNGWKIVLKGILFRLILIGYPQMAILCLWELTVRDSAAEVVLALFYFIAICLALLWAALKVVRIARRSVQMHSNPAYILYSDPAALNKWGFLYVQFRATAYYFIFPALVYILLKAVFVAFAQNAPVPQTIGLVVIEAVFLVAVSILRPWMDKKTNTFNIAIAVINFINVIFLLMFTGVFNQPYIVTGIMGVIFFVYNAAFSLVLILMVIVTSVLAIFSKNPDTRYQPMRDDRGSFIKSQNNLNTELDALGATARGDMRMKARDLDDDSDSLSSGSMGRQQYDASGVALPPSTSASARNVPQYEPPHSPIDPSQPFIPSAGAPRHGPPTAAYSDYSGNGYSDNRYGEARNGSPAPRGNYAQHNGSGNLSNQDTSYRPQANAGPWQRGAGYDR